LFNPSIARLISEKSLEEKNGCLAKRNILTLVKWKNNSFDFDWKSY